MHNPSKCADVSFHFQRPADRGTYEEKCWNSTTLNSVKHFQQCPCNLKQTKGMFVLIESVKRTQPQTNWNNKANKDGNAQEEKSMRYDDQFWWFDRSSRGEIQKEKKEILLKTGIYHLWYNIYLLFLSVKIERLNWARGRRISEINYFETAKIPTYILQLFMARASDRDGECGGQRVGERVRARGKTKNVSERQTKMYLWDTWPDRSSLARSLSLSLALITYEFVGFVFLFFADHSPSFI